MPPGKVKLKKKKKTNQNLQSIYLFYSLPIHGIDVFPNIPRKQSNFSYPWQLLSVVFSGITECNHCKNLALQLVSSCSYNGRTLSWSWHTGNVSCPWLCDLSGCCVCWNTLLWAELLLLPIKPQGSGIFCVGCMDAKRRTKFTIEFWFETRAF